ncbi:carbohydrate kinase family protein [Blautia schinkii]|nr:carbohydrate kinase family protein [Blautia schinkii]
MIEKDIDVICIGFAAQDIVMLGIPQDALLRDSVTARKTEITSGGDANNQAVVLGRLGSRTALLVKLGADAMSDSIYSELEKEPVNLSFVQRSAEVQNLLAICVCRDDGQRSFLLDPGKNYHWSQEEIADSILDRTKAISLGSLFHLGKLDTGDGEILFRRAKERGILTFADMTADIGQIGPDTVKGIYPYTDFLMPSLTEAVYITGEREPERIARFFLKSGVQNVVIKLGDKGCYFKNLKEEFYMDAFSVPVVDTTGCGDNFVAGFIHQVLKGASMRTAVRFGCAVGAVNASQAGAHHAVENEAQIEKFIQKSI